MKQPRQRARGVDKFGAHGREKRSLKKAARSYQAAGGVGSDGFVPRVSARCVTNERRTCDSSKVEQCGRWPQSFCTTMFFFSARCWKLSSKWTDVITVRAKRTEERSVWRLIWQKHSCAFVRLLCGHGRRVSTFCQNIFDVRHAATSSTRGGFSVNGASGSRS